MTFFLGRNRCFRAQTASLTKDLESILKIIILSALVLVTHAANAETVQVKYGNAVSLNSFSCTDVKENSDVSRVCYDRAERYMLVQLKATYYHYCEVDPATAQSFQGAASKRQFFEGRVKGNGADGPFDCRTHLVPKKYRGCCNRQEALRRSASGLVDN
jgi:hypothetical protein